MLNSIRPWEALRQYSKTQFFVLLDDMDKAVLDRLRVPSFIKVVQVPKTFKTVQAKYKARALEYFRKNQQLTDQDWILHLDEESKIDHAVVQACIDFIEKGREDIGMVSRKARCRHVLISRRNELTWSISTDIDTKGTIYYNDVNHWTSALLSAAEIIRIAEDYGRFQLPVKLFGRPLLGWMHGSWILINGVVEDKVTWETACMAEDFWFAYKVSQSCLFLSF